MLVDLSQGFVWCYEPVSGSDPVFVVDLEVPFRRGEVGSLRLLSVC